jgi:hypothetical protein
VDAYFVASALTLAMAAAVLQTLVESHLVSADVLPAVPKLDEVEPHRFFL